MVIEQLIAKQLGLKIDLGKVRHCLLQQKHVQKAILVNYPLGGNKMDIVAFIEPDDFMSDVEAKQFITDTFDRLDEVLVGYLLPTVFIITDQLRDVPVAAEMIEEMSRSHAYYDLKAKYWAKQLNGITPCHSLPLDKARQMRHKGNQHLYTVELEPQKVQQLLSLSQRYDLPLFSMLQSLFSLLIARFSNETEVVLGVKITGIKSASNNPVVNLFSERLILRSIVDGNPEFIDFVRQNLQQTHSAYSHRNISFSRLLKALQLEPDGSVHPIYQLMFHYQHNVDSKEVRDDSALVSDVMESLQFKYDLELNVMEMGDRLSVNWLYNANLFNKQSIVQMSLCYDALLDGIIASCERAVYDLPLLAGESLQRVSGFASQSAVAFPNNPLHTLFQQQAEQSPDRAAIVFGEQSLTYGQLEKTANQIAHLLISEGMTHKLVGLCMERSALLVAGILGVFKANASYLPLDPSYPISRLNYVLGDSNVDLILTCGEALKALEGIDCQVKCLDNPHTQKQLNSCSDIAPELTPKKAHQAYVIYTSGSTGQPKGVIGTHASVVNRLNWMHRHYPVRPGEIFASRTTIAFVDHIAEVFQPLIFGGTLVMLSREQCTHVTELTSAIAQHEIERITLVPSLLLPMMESGQREKLQSLRYITSSGEPLNFRIVECFHQLFSNETVLLNLYGATEVGADVTCYQLDHQEQSKILSYFNKQDTEVRIPQSGVSDIFGSLSDLTQDEQGTLFTSPNIVLEDLKDKFSDTAIPGSPLALEDYLSALKDDLLPYIIDVSSEKYIGHMTSALPNFIPEFSRLIAKYNQNIVKTETSKSMTLMERQVLAMIHRLFYNHGEAQYQASIQDPHFLHGIITSGGSLANITALYCARNKGLLKLGISAEELKNSGANRVLLEHGWRDAVILVSQLAHYSVRKAAALLGIGLDGLITIEQDENQRIKTDVLQQRIKECRENKRFIIAVIGIAGATETGTIDPIEDMAAITEQHDLHFHVDAAWGGAFMFSDKYRHKLKGIERADSITFCAHKQLYLAQGISLCVFKDPKSIFAVTTHAEYQAMAGSYDLGQFTIEGSRPATSLLLHASLHLLGKNGYGWLVDQGMEKSAYFRQLIEDSEGFELIGDNDLNIINYRYIPLALRGAEGRFNEAQNREITDAVQLIQRTQFLEGKTFVSHTKIFHKATASEKISVFRVVLTNPTTSHQDMVDVLQDQLRIASNLIEDQAVPQVLSYNTSLFEFPSTGRFSTPIGKPIDNVNVYVLDGYFNHVPIGVTGELYVAGVSLAEGYLDYAELTDERFLDNPFGEGKLYKTGDLARRLSDGNIEFIGRSDNQVKIRGMRVELAEIEFELAGSALVKEAVVISRKDFRGEDALMAYVVCNDAGEHIDRNHVSQQLNELLGNKLPEHMIPNEIKVMDAIPLTHNGKADMKQLLLS